MGNEIVVDDKRSASLDFSKEPDLSILAVMERLSMNTNLDADKIEKLFNVFIEGQRKMREMADEQAFSNGMAEFKKNPPDIIKNRTAKLQGTARGSGKEYSFEYKYADLDAYCKEAMPLLAQHGITWSFPFSQDDKGKITVSCVLRYGLYRHTPTTLSGMPEGGSNPLQANGVAVAYLERYTFCGATGLTAEMPDKDGNHLGMTSEDVESYLKTIRTAPDNQSVDKVYLAAKKAAVDAKDSKSLQVFTEAGAARRRELKNA